MSVIGGKSITLSEHGKRLNPDGMVAKIVELLSQTNEILEDATWLEGNLQTGHRTTVRADLPEVSWRKLNYGVKPSKSKTKQVDDTCGMLEAYAEMDKAILELNGNDKEFRLSEDSAFLEAMNQEFARVFAYGDTSLTPEKYLGLAARFNTLDCENVINCGGTGNTCTSVYLVVWGDNTAHFTFPKGSSAGLSQKDLGEVTLEDENGGRYQGMRTHFKWTPGLVIRDWRYVIRLANIDMSDLASISLNNKFIEAIGLIPSLNMGKAAFYCNRQLRTGLSLEASNKPNVQLTSENWEGKLVTKFMGIPLRIVDAILNTEAALTASA